MISIENLSVQFKGEYLFSNVSFKINPEDKIGIAGPNGSGKTTLLRILYGEQSYESGSINIKKDLKIGYLPQDFISEPSSNSLFEEIYSSNKQLLELEKAEQSIIKKLETEYSEDLINKLGDIHLKLENFDREKYKSKIEKILIGLGFNESEFSKPVNEFSGGWRMRIALTKLLAADYDVLLLDEPTNHLDLDSLEFLISYLKKFPGALLIVSHDHHFLKTVTTKTLGFMFGEVELFPGDIDNFFNIQEQRREQLIATYKNQLSKKKQLEKFIERFRYKATKASQVQSRIKMLEKIDFVELPETEKTISFNFNNAPKSGKVVFTLKNVTKVYDKVILKNADLEIQRGDKIAVLGANGTGKTTIAKIIAGIENYQEGEAIKGHNVIIGYYSQDVAENLDLNLTVLETVENIDPTKTTGDLRTLLGCFLFRGDDVFKKVKVLSGGEKSRLALAKILLSPCNLLIMDEPTNHLDFESKKVLQDALLDFEGTLIIVSHDVDFLEPLTNKVLEIINQKPVLRLGTISEYMEKYASIENDQTEKEIKEKKTDNRKLQKRIEAEQRQKLYLLTKEHKKELELVEKKISELEKIKNEYEILINKNEFSHQENLQKFFKEYQTTLNELDELYLKWDTISTKISEIEKNFVS